MLLAVLSLGGAIMGATAIAGLLMLYQIRATTDSENSAKAIFAADSGVEWALFDYYCDTTSTANPTSRCMGATREQAMPALSNGAAIQVDCYDNTGVATTTCSNTSTVATAVSRGSSLDSRRAFTLFVTSVTSTLP